MSEVQRYGSHPVDGQIAAREIDALHEAMERANGLRALVRMAFQDFTEYDAAIEQIACPTLRARLIQVENAAYTEWRSVMQRYMRRGSGITEEGFELNGRQWKQGYR